MPPMTDAVKDIVAGIVGIGLALGLVLLVGMVALWRQSRRFKREDREHRDWCVAQFDASAAQQGLYWNQTKQTYEYRPCQTP